MTSQAIIDLFKAQLAVFDRDKDEITHDDRYSKGYFNGTVDTYIYVIDFLEKEMQK